MGFDDPAERALVDLLDAEVQFIVVQAKAAAGRPKDHMVIPILVATLEASEKRK
jgi:hypothetical protein